MFSKHISSAFIFINFLKSRDIFSKLITEVFLLLILNTLFAASSDFQTYFITNDAQTYYIILYIKIKLPVSVPCVWRAFAWADKACKEQPCRAHCRCIRPLTKTFAVTIKKLIFNKSLSNISTVKTILF